MPLPALALAAAAPIMQGITGIIQSIGGRNQLKNLERPQYEIPNEQKQALAIARQQYADPYMAGENRMLDQNAMAAQNALTATAQGGAPLSAIAAVQARQSQGAANIGVASAQAQERDAAGYQAALGQMAQYRDQEWQMNKYAPYMQKYNEGRERIGAGQQNMFSALNALGNIGMAEAYNRSGAAPGEVAASAAQSNGITQTLTRAYQSYPNQPGQYGNAVAMYNSWMGAQNVPSQGKPY
jgi:hypothetical protein